MKKIYSPNQIKTATFLGGPLAAAFFLKKAFNSIEKDEIAKWTFYASLVATVIIIFSSPFLPENLPNNVIPMMYLIPVILVLNRHYITKDEIANSPEYQFESNWKVFGVSLAFAVIFMIVGVGLLYITESDDDVAQRVVDNINGTKIELNIAFTDMKASKDTNGSGVILNFTLNNNYIYDFKNTDQELLRNMSIQFIGAETLTDLASSNIYFIINFNTLTGEVVKKVILSPSNTE